MSDLEKLQNITHHYRKSLEAYEARTGHKPQSVDTVGSGEEKEKFARMDADMTAVELRAQNAALEARLSKIEKTPKFNARVPGARADRIESSDDYTNRYMSALLSGDQRELRAVTALANDSAGAGIPTDMERRIVERMYQQSVMRQLGVVNQVDSKRTITIESGLPTTTKTAESIADPGTGTAATLTFPTFGTQIAVAYTKYVTPVKMSQEFLEDAIGSGGIGSGMDYVARKCAQSMALKHDEQFTMGDGSGDPQGVALKALITQKITSATVAAITADNIIDTYHAVPVPYRTSPKFSWLMSDAVLKTVRKLKTTNGDFIFSPNNTGAGQMTVGLPATVYGVPYALSQWLPNDTNALGSGSAGVLAANDVLAAIGDFSYFEIFDRTGITSLIDPYSAALSGQTTLYMYSRTDSRVMQKEAFATLVTA
jgi:HK97 family phage major capsid protein